jgi:hypothetical protein
MCGSRELTRTYCLCSYPFVSAPQTLVLHPRYDEDSQLLWQAAVSRGWQVVRSQSYSVPISESRQVAVYGGYMWSQQAAEQLEVKLSAPPDDWLVNAPLHATHRSTYLVNLGSVTQFPVFAKSLSGKSIPSRVYHHRDDLPPGSEEECVLVQPVVRWEREYRAFMLGGEVRALSQYADHGQLQVAPWGFDALNYCRDAAAYLTSIVRDLDLPYACVVDVGEIAGASWFDRWAVVEPNPAWCSGIYACDPDAVLDVVAASCGRILT